MNTRSGKTVVGLTILQSCLNEGKGPAVYVVPDNYLVSQVCAEANKLGIRVAYDKRDNEGKLEKGEEDYYFKSKKAILITNIHKLVNGKSVFGMRLNGGNIPIGSIIIDDVHACLDTIEQQYSVAIDTSSELYNNIIKMFREYMEIKNERIFSEIESRNSGSSSNFLIPFWIWQKCCKEVNQLLNTVDPESNEGKKIRFTLPLLIDNWETCNCVISSSKIEITPKGIDISKITSFDQAERRIFMSATLANDNIFISAMGLKSKDVSNVITPEKANDIGERLILFPKNLNPQINDSIVVEKIANIALRYNVVVIVPSFERLVLWKNVYDGLSIKPSVQVLSSRDKNIEVGVSKLKDGTFNGLTFLVNKYDGIDLPDNACRYLVIDGLPIMRSMYDMVRQEMTPNSRRTCSEQIQKIEQGMGRGVRSNRDYCIVVLMGNKLADVLVNQDGSDFFSNATKSQYDLSKNMWDQLMKCGEKPSVDDVFSLADYVINRDPDWISVNKDILALVKYDNVTNIDKITIAERQAFEKSCLGKYEEAFNIIQTAVNENKELNNNDKGLLKQLMAEYKNFINPSEAQEILFSARDLNKKLIKPIAGVGHCKLLNHENDQAQSALNFAKQFSDDNSYLICVYSILDDLIFKKNCANSFEEAIKNIARVIGFASSRPEKEASDGGPDDLWAIGNLEYFVIECKNGVDENTVSISKSDCSQLLSSVQWFANNYTNNDFKCYPIIVHRAEKFDTIASPSLNMRIITESKLNSFKESVKDFAVGMTQSSSKGNIQEVSKLLKHYNLIGNKIIEGYTLQAKRN